MDPTQANRLASIKTSLADDDLVLSAFHGDEGISKPFQYIVDVVGKSGDIVISSLLGKPAGFRLDLGKKGTRYFHGYVARISQLPAEKAGARFQLEIVPWLWFLTRTSNCRIFQEMTALEIIDKVFRDHGFSDFKDKTSRSYDKRTYCVQYRETAFNFVSRLMEEEGIYYYFIHDDSRHYLVLADSPSSHSPFENYAQVPWNPSSEGDQIGEHIREWYNECQLQPGKYTHRSFDFIKPNTQLESSASFQDGVGGTNFEVYDYSGSFENLDAGDRLAAVRINELGSGQDVFRGGGNPMGLAAGFTFELTGHPRQDQGKEYLITGVHHQFSQSDYITGGAASSAPYACHFSATLASRQFHPPRVTPKPRIQGPQTAFVVGKAGEEIWVDKYGRVKLKFHWDRTSTVDETTSCWVRVSSGIAGKKWGSIMHPRVGQEVIVEFIDGDPDQPIVTGRVYNGTSLPPYDLPAQSTISTFKSNTSKGGGGFNELRFQDKKGEEQIFVHAEKNLDIRIKKDRFEWVGDSRHLIVKKDHFEKVENNHHETVTNDHFIKIGKDRHLKVGGKEAKEVAESHSFTVKGDVIEVFKKNHSEQVTNDYFLKADNAVIEGLSNITLKVGGSSIAIGPDGIALKTSGTVKIEASATMDLKATGPLNMSSSAMAELKAPMSTVKGDGMLTLKGGLVMIN